MEGIKIRKFQASDLGSIERIVKSLHPDWFTEEALKNIPRDIQFAKCFVAEKGGKLVGFVSVYSDLGKPMIGWIGVDRKLRRKGTGRQLIERVEEELKKFDYKDLRVETVGECDPVYKPYSQTVKFYKSAGFEVEKRGRLRTNRERGTVWKWRLSTFRKTLE